MSELVVNADTLTQEQLEKYTELLREWKSTEKSLVHFRGDEVRAAFEAGWIQVMPTGAKATITLASEINKLFKEVTTLDPKASEP